MGARAFTVFEMLVWHFSTFAENDAKFFCLKLGESEDDWFLHTLGYVGFLKIYASYTPYRQMDPLKIAARVAAKPQEETGIIKKTPGKGYCVKSEKKDSNWSGGCYPSKAKAEARLKQVEFFKHKKKGKGKSKKKSSVLENPKVASSLDYMMQSIRGMRWDQEMTQQNLDDLFTALHNANAALGGYIGNDV